MPKPKVIIADTDINYIIPLLQKFTEEYFDQVEIEIITDFEYFEGYFSTPQRADILIISEELYSPAINRHSISNIFVMTEQYDEHGEENANAFRIYKYTNVKEIFTAIVGRSTLCLNNSDDGRRDTQVILVYSACGGVGKTTIALGLSACLSRNYKNVLYINAERLQTFQSMLSNSSPISAADVYSKLANLKEKDDIYPEIRHVEK